MQAEAAERIITSMTSTNLVLFLAVVALTLFAIYRRSTAASTVAPREVAPPAFEPRLAAFLKAFHSATSETDADYAAALAALQQDPERMIAAIADGTRQCAPGDYALRRALLYAASSLGHPAALPLLADAASRRFKEIPSPDFHEQTLLTQEMMLRTTAVEGIEQLARAGHEGALDSLLTLSDSPVLSVRVLSFTALRAADSSGQIFSRAAARLKQEDRFLLHYRRVPIEEVPGINDPRVHLMNPEQNIARPPLLSADSPEGYRPAAAPASGAPKSARKG
ncbi:MAG: hypothetical protein HY235_12055 [Acidobacteria bacterium]|nr:hypothetical protein [Acidobacteriota bacterium]